MKVPLLNSSNRYYINNQRELIIDFIRGLLIINMILVHFSVYFPHIVGRIVNFVDVAIEGFIFIAGFMIGRHYLKKFISHRKEVTKRLFLRAAQLVCIQYIMIITISLPFYSYFKLKTASEIFDFILSSFLFLNQPPILHILPTFIPLLIMSPIILLMLNKNWDYILLFSSIVVFLASCYNPHILNIGDKTIFPVLLWQIYFVFGSFLGKLSLKDITTNGNKILPYAIALYIILFIVKYGGFINKIHIIKSTYDIYPKKYPLNIYGFLYGSSFLVFLYSIIIRFWETIKAYRFFSVIVPLLGRYSLATFVVHVYLEYVIRFFNALGFNKYSIYLTVTLSFVIIFIIIYQTDKMKKKGRLPLVYKLLFC